MVTMIRVKDTDNDESIVLCSSRSEDMATMRKCCVVAEKVLKKGRVGDGVVRRSFYTRNHHNNCIPIIPIIID